MNYVFDVGNVLINFKPETFLRDLLNDPPEEENMLDVIFRSPEWLMLDAGDVAEERARAVFVERAPASRHTIAKVMDRLPDMLTPIDETIALLPAVKTAGHRTYYLSNYHKRLSAYITQKYAFFELFDGGLFSCDAHVIKPDREIYAIFLARYGLNPSECVFFDDVEVNVQAAIDAGMRGVLFRDARDVESYIAGGSSAQRPI